jgi:hypothetical protein
MMKKNEEKSIKNVKNIISNKKIDTILIENVNSDIYPLQSDR